MEGSGLGVLKRRPSSLVEGAALNLLKAFLNQAFFRGFGKLSHGAFGRLRLPFVVGSGLEPEMLQLGRIFKQI